MQWYCGHQARTACEFGVTLRRLLSMLLVVDSLRLRHGFASGFTELFLQPLAARLPALLLSRLCFVSLS